MVTLVISARWAENTELPKDRAKLYELVVKAILSAQYSEAEGKEELINFGGEWSDQRQWLSKIAYEMHQGGKAGAAIPESRIKEILKDTLSEEKLHAFVDATRYRGSLLKSAMNFFNLCT